MKKIILGLAIASLVLSCKEETQEKVKAASKAVGSDVKEGLNSAKIKAKKIIDSSKIKDKAKVLIEKGAEKVEKGAKKIKESVRK